LGEHPELRSGSSKGATPAGSASVIRMRGAATQAWRRAPSSGSGNEADTGTSSPRRYGLLRSVPAGFLCCPFLTPWALLSARASPQSRFAGQSKVISARALGVGLCG